MTLYDTIYHHIENKSESKMIFKQERFKVIDTQTKNKENVVVKISFMDEVLL